MPLPIEITDYNPRWPDSFAVVRDRLAHVLGVLTHRIEHVGSTAVPGLPAKPVIDIDVVIRTRDDLPAVIARLQAAGYHHRGDLGITGREALRTPPNTPAHHLYVCAADNPELERHLRFRDVLRTHPQTAQAYAALKRSLAAKFRTNRDAYTESKTTFIEQVLAKAIADVESQGHSTALSARRTDPP
ncbi:GrpB family protein [Frankia gtarii]|uniref:GrpB family protein n=1 Tax=Frankia gtarii TaxID=2950102 RepID=UPI0021BFDF96|nr:GrpB family protein [Frankia gtarii]